jgi:hypothetical protein
MANRLRTACAVVLAGSALGTTAVPASADAQLTATAVLTDASGATVHRFTCSWSSGMPHGRDCAAIVGDGPDEVALAERYGAERLSVALRAADGSRSIDRTLSRRADGTWHARGAASDAAGSRTWGFVCDSDGTRCVRWMAGPGTSRPGEVRAHSASRAERLAARRLARR